MDYNKIILDNTKEDELFHKAVQDLKREYAVLAKAIAQGEQGSAAIVVGAMEREVNLLLALDPKKNPGKETVNVA